MKDLPHEVCGMIMDSVKHDPVYILEYFHVKIRYLVETEQGEPEIDTSTEHKTKLITLSGDLQTPTIFPDNECAECEFKQSLLSHYELPAEVKFYKNHAKMQMPTEEFLKKGCSIKIGKGGLDQDIINVLSIKRFC